MEKSTKTILWVLAFITLPITIPLAIISFGIIATVFILVLSTVLVFVKEVIAAIVIMLLGYGIYKWLSRNG